MLCCVSVVLNMYFKAAGRRDNSVKRDTRSSSVSVIYFCVLCLTYVIKVSRANSGPKPGTHPPLSVS